MFDPIALMQAIRERVPLDDEAVWGAQDVLYVVQEVLAGRGEDVELRRLHVQSPVDHIRVLQGFGGVSFDYLHAHGVDFDYGGAVDMQDKREWMCDYLSDRRGRNEANDLFGVSQLAGAEVSPHPVPLPSVVWEAIEACVGSAVSQCAARVLDTHTPGGCVARGGTRL